MKDRPCYVRLENVEHRCEYELPTLSFILITILLTLMFSEILRLLHTPRYLSSVLLLVLIPKMSWRYRTDCDGLHIEGHSWFGYQRSSIIKWADVADAHLVNPKYGKIKLRLNNGKRRLITLGDIRNNFIDISNHRLEASIYQHLQKVGRAGNLLLRPDAESYFLEIPDWVPETMFVDRVENGFLTRYNVDADALEVKWIPDGEEVSYVDDFPEDRIEFDKAPSLEWYAYTLNEFEVEVSTGNADTKIEVNENELEMQKLVLALVRQLRKNPATDAVWLPDVLVEYLKERRENYPQISQIYAD